MESLRLLSLFLCLFYIVWAMLKSLAYVALLLLQFAPVTYYAIYTK